MNNKLNQSKPMKCWKDGACLNKRGIPIESSVYWAIWLPSLSSIFFLSCQCSSYSGYHLEKLGYYLLFYLTSHRRKHCSLILWVFCWFVRNDHGWLLCSFGERIQQAIWRRKNKNWSLIENKRKKEETLEMLTEGIDGVWCTYTFSGQYCSINRAANIYLVIQRGSIQKLAATFGRLGLQHSEYYSTKKDIQCLNLNLQEILLLIIDIKNFKWLRYW